MVGVVHRSSGDNTVVNPRDIYTVLALASRRLHDIGKSGWWQILPLGVRILGLLLLQRPLGSLLFLLLGLILFFGSYILFFIWVLRQGDEGPNKYGLDPRQTTSQ